LENQYIYDIQINHYIDNGCFCQHCDNKRRKIFSNAKLGYKHFDKIIHSEVVNELKNEQINLINNKLKLLIKEKEKRMKEKKPKQFGLNINFK
jgi:hypothetical protein